MPTYDNQAPIVTGNDLWRPGGGGLAGLCTGVVGFAGNMSVDPVFASAATGDYHLRANSPLIDAGVNGISMAPDVDGDVRPFDGDENGTAKVDIGFDESDDPLAVVPGDLSFGDVPLKRTSSSNVTLKNYGSATLSITTVAFSGPAGGDYSTPGQTCAGASLAVGQSCTIPVASSHGARGEERHPHVTGPGEVGTRTIPVTGTGIDPIVISPPSVTFTDINVGDAGTPGSITVTNTGGVPATISSITVTGNATDVTIGAQTCTSAPIAQDGTCVIPFTWRPKDSGDRAASIVLVALPRSAPAPSRCQVTPGRPRAASTGAPRTRQDRPEPGTAGRHSAGPSSQAANASTSSIRRIASAVSWWPTAGRRSASTTSGARADRPGRHRND